MRLLFATWLLATLAPASEPEIDARLEEAAAALAAAAAEAGDLSPLRNGEALRLEITRAEVWMGEPQVVGVVASDPERGKRRLRERIAAHAQLRPTHMGFGSAGMGDGSHAVVAIFGRIAVEWSEPLPTSLPAQSQLRLRGRLLHGLRHPQVHLIPPGGIPVRLPLERVGEEFAAELYLHTPGRTVLEVMAVGPQGPEVALLGHIYVGEAIPSRAEFADSKAEPFGIEAMRAELDGLRARRGLAALRADPRLEEVARAYAEEMIASGRFAHVSPESGEVGDRLRRAGYSFLVAGENLGEGPSAKAAHRAILQSPAHLSAVLEPRFEAIGIGIARAREGERPRVVVVHVLASP